MFHTRSLRLFQLKYKLYYIYLVFFIIDRLEAKIQFVNKKQMALSWTKHNVEIERVPAKDMTDEKFLTYIRQSCPLIITNLTHNLDCKKWTLDRLKTISNPIQVRGKTDLETYRKGTKYCIHETTLSEYIDDLQKQHPRSKSRYLAALNIKKALKQISNESHIPDFFSSHKIHSGPFLWLARNGHYEYTHMDPDEGCLVMIQGQKQVRLFNSTFPDLLKPNKLGSLGRTIQSTVDLEQENPASELTNHYAILDEGDV